MSSPIRVDNAPSTAQRASFGRLARPRVPAAQEAPPSLLLTALAIRARRVNSPPTRAASSVPIAAWGRTIQSWVRHHAPSARLAPSRRQLAQRIARRALKAATALMRAQRRRWSSSSAPPAITILRTEATARWRASRALLARATPSPEASSSLHAPIACPDPSRPTVPPNARAAYLASTLICLGRHHAKTAQRAISASRGAPRRNLALAVSMPIRRSSTLRAFWAAWAIA